ncbi:hypothetical protein GCM10009839_39220 [Catenulispora yoronensis]|uniref:Uncharacterized protein n=1 Tax=Catenulispora yoronensis TaxID=450799 RepID=A0ABP5FZJ8_9ACTN
MPDVVSVPEAAGREALVRLLGYGQPAVAPGPVALSAGGRVLFYVADGGAQDLPELLEWLDWGGVRLDLTAVAGSDLTDPPVRWLHPATVPMQRPGSGAGGGSGAGSGAGGGTGETAGAPGANVAGITPERAEDTSAGTPKNALADGMKDAAKNGTEVLAAGSRGASRRDAYPTPGLPEPPELIALLATIAAACHRLAVAAAR